MSAGDLSERVNILRPVKTSDGQGGHSVAWVDLVTGSATALTRLPAEVRPLTAREALSAAAIAATISYIVTMRYRGDLDETMRVQWTPYKGVAKTLEIHGVTALDGGRAYITMPCSET